MVALGFVGLDTVGNWVPAAGSVWLWHLRRPRSTRRGKRRQVLCRLAISKRATCVAIATRRPAVSRCRGLWWPPWTSEASATFVR